MRGCFAPKALIPGIPDIPAKAKAGTPKADGFTGAGIGTAGFLAFIVGKVKTLAGWTGTGAAAGTGAAEEGTIAPKSGVAISLIACVTYF
jgi:hypothetical protein